MPVAPTGGMSLWYRPEQLPAVPDGTPFPLWTSAVEQGPALIQASAPLMPVLTVGLVNGFNAAIFTRVGATRKLMSLATARDFIPTTVPLHIAYTIYAVANIVTPTGVATGPAVTAASSILQPALDGSATVERAFVGGQVVTAGTAFNPTETHIWHVRRFGSGVEVGADGIPLGNGSVTAATAVDLSGLSLAVPGGPGNRGTAVVEVLAYDWYVDDENHAANVAYLKSKYAL